MLDTKEMVNMMNFIREKTTRCRSDIANVFDRINELDSIANALEQQVRADGGDVSGPVTGGPVGAEEIHNVNDIGGEAEGQMDMQFEEVEPEMSSTTTD
jgi:hypothetical protein